MCYDFATSTPGVIVTETDYAEQYQGTPNGEIQSEHFGKDASVSMEMRIVTYNGKFEGEDTADTVAVTKKTLTYCVLSDENTQNASTTFQNLKLVLDDILVKQKEMSVNDLRYIIDICDGCSVQYKCGAALYSLTITATTRKCIFFGVSNVLVMGSADVIRRVAYARLVLTSTSTGLLHC